MILLTCWPVPTSAAVTDAVSAPVAVDADVGIAVEPTVSVAVVEAECIQARVEGRAEIGVGGQVGGSAAAAHWRGRLAGGLGHVALRLLCLRHYPIGALRFEVGTGDVLLLALGQLLRRDWHQETV